MIAYLEGQVIIVEKNQIVLKTSEGVGYLVNIISALSSTLSFEDFLVLHIHTNVKEDDISLYGFKDIKQKEFFTMLIKTSGVGPKLGLAVLSVFSPNQLIQIIINNNSESLSQVPGIGKKTAAKLCLDLKDKLKNHNLIQFSNNSHDKYKNIETDLENDSNSLFSALKNLGYQEKEIIKVLSESSNNKLTFDERIKKALSLLAPLR